MKTYPNIPQLHSAVEIKNIFNNHFDPNDLVLHYENDLSGDEFDNYGIATRVDTLILVIRSMKQLNATTIDEFSYNYSIQSHIEYDSREPLKGVIAVIGSQNPRNRFGRIIPEDIQQLLDEAEMTDPKYFLSWAKYEGLCVISSHPEANNKNFN